MYGPACEPETSYQLLFNMEFQGKHKCNRKKSVINFFIIHLHLKNTHELIISVNLNRI